MFVQRMRTRPQNKSKPLLSMLTSLATNLKETSISVDMTTPYLVCPCESWVRAAQTGNPAGHFHTKWDQRVSVQEVEACYLARRSSMLARITWTLTEPCSSGRAPSSTSSVLT